MTQDPISMPFARRMLTAVAIVATVMLVLLLFWFGISVFLLLFASLLLAVFLYSASCFISTHTFLTYTWALAGVVLLLNAVLVLSIWLTGAALGEQINELIRRVPHSLEGLQKHLQHHEWAQHLLVGLRYSGAQFSEQTKDVATEVVAQVPQTLSSVLGGIGFFIIFLFLGMYIAINPGVYTRGLLRLIPQSYRGRLQQVLEEIGQMLGRWLVGRMISMLVVGTLTTAGLWLLGVPLALALGFLAALGELIPNIGPFLAFIPAVLLALTENTTLALAVIALYLLLQGIESFVLTPVVEKRAVDLPPALTITAQVLMGLLAGGLGLALAAPLTATTMLLVQRLYVEDILGDRLDVPPG